METGMPAGMIQAMPTGMPTGMMEHHHHHTGPIEMKGKYSPLRVVAVPELPLSVLNGKVASVANPCVANITDKLLTKAIVEVQYPGFKWGNSEPWTAQEMQCWAWLATKSEEVHPGRQFDEQYKFEPFLLQL